MTDHFPHHPGFKERGGTSQAAAIIMAETAPALRARCLALIAAAPDGLNAHEVADRLRWELCSVRARISELFAMGKVRKAGRRPSPHGRASSVVWAAVPEAEVEAEAARVREAARRRANARVEQREAA